jgi:hypothetical protein
MDPLTDTRARQRRESHRRAHDGLIGHVLR